MANANTLNREERDQVETLAETLGDAGAAAALRIHYSTLIKALARRPLRSSTIQCVRSRLRELATAELSRQ